MTVLLVAIGGALGSVARYALSTAVHRLLPPVFPFGTFAVNLVGCIVFGVIAGAAQQRVALAPELRAFFLIGVLGGFTTFSSFAFESVQLVRDGQLLFAALNVCGQVVAGFLGLLIAFNATGHA